jgi:lysophospholipase L1-like esterase
VTPAPQRPPQPEPFLRGCAFPAGAGVTYPRADPADFTRLPIDTWGTAQLPVTVRFELVGDAEAIDIAYRTETDDFGYRGPGAGHTFAAWRAGEQVAGEDAVLGDGTVRLPIGTAAADQPTIVYVPEGMKPTVLSITAVNGSIEPAPRQARWLAYGDSVAEGWIASGPAGAWPAIAGREQGLDVHNFGFAGAARGEIVSAEHLAGLPADVISVTHGTNCWTRIPHSAGMMRETTRAFLDVLRQGHPDTPIVVVSPVVRPDAEETPNKLGASLADLRQAMEKAVQERIDAGDKQLQLIPGRDLIDASQLGDGIHPDDDGHRALAAAIGPAVRRAVGG